MSKNQSIDIEKLPKFLKEGLSDDDRHQIKQTM